MRQLGEIDADTFSRKPMELRDRIGVLTGQMWRKLPKLVENAIKVFELLQALEPKWVTADHAEKRQLLDLVCLNFFLDDVSLVPTMRKPFDLLMEGLEVLSSRGDRI